jgi:predicted protein tyrosine phosphatase
MPMLIIVTAREARELVQRSNQCENVLSINDNGFLNFDDSHRAKIQNLMELQFDDVNHSEIPTAPKLSHIEQIVVWAKVCESETALIHCNGSGARSTAAALITMVEWGYGAEHASTLVKTMRPTSQPNVLMLRLYGDRELIEAATSRFKLLRT